MLELLSGRTHAVLTGIAAVTGKNVYRDLDITQVTFNRITDSEIAKYIVSGEPLDKAGAYAIQGYAARWIPRIEGCYFNVVGLPIARTSLCSPRRSWRRADRRETVVVDAYELFDAGDHRCQQSRSRHEVLDDDRFVRRMSPVADCAHPVECRHAEGGGEVAVGAAAGRGFVEREAELCSERRELS